MFSIKVSDKEYKFKYAYEPTLKSEIMDKLVNLNRDTEGSGRISDVMRILPELLVAGLQVYHHDEFGCDYEDRESVNKAFSKACSLIDNYYEADDSMDPGDLINALQDVMMENGFLKKLFQKKMQEE